MKADIADKNADAEYKRGLLQYEPWKPIVTAFATGAALVGAVVALESYLYRPAPTFPPGTVITIPSR